MRYVAVVGIFEVGREKEIRCGRTVRRLSVLTELH